MPGLLEEFGYDLTEIEAPSFDVPDGIYDFTVGSVYIQNGTEKFPDKAWIIIEYLIADTGKKKLEWFQLPADASAPTDKELEKLGYYKNRLIDLGIAPEDVNSAGPDDLVGVSGTLVAFTRNGFQNVKNVKIGETADAPDSTPEEPAAPAVKTPAARKPAAAKAAPAAEEAAPAAAAPARPKNPFGPK